LISVG